jgi:hypothetical protein
MACVYTHTVRQYSTAVFSLRGNQHTVLRTVRLSRSFAWRPFVHFAAIDWRQSTGGNRFGYPSLVCIIFHLSRETASIPVPLNNQPTNSSTSWQPSTAANSARSGGQQGSRRLSTDNPCLPQQTNCPAIRSNTVLAAPASVHPLLSLLHFDSNRRESKRA